MSQHQKRSKPPRGQKEVELERLVHRVSLQRQQEAKRLTAELDRKVQENFLQTSNNFLQQEQDKTK